MLLFNGTDERVDGWFNKFITPTLYHVLRTLLCKDAILPRESGVCERKCTDSESIWSTGVRGKEGGVALGRGGAGPLREVVEPIRYL